MMLKIRSAQMDVLAVSAERSFEDEMVAHSKEFSPKLCNTIGEDQLRIALRQTLLRARAHGFFNRGPQRLFVEMMFLFGSGFESDPQYPWVSQILQTAGNQMSTADRLFKEIVKYQENVSGPDGVHTWNALSGLAGLARQPLLFLSHDFQASMRQEMIRVFPQKAAYIGNEGLLALIEEASGKARAYQLPRVEGDALLAVLMFAFGHGCTEDPLYPWIARTLQDERIVDPVMRAQRLKSKSLTWLDHVLAQPHNPARP